MNPKKHFSIPINVRFRDIDAMGHVNNSVYFTYFEQGRLDFFKAANVDGAFPGFSFILAHISCDYLRPLTIDNQVTLQIQVAKIGRKSFSFTYALVDRTDGKMVYATGESVQVCFDYAQNKTMAVDPDLKQLLSKFTVDFSG